MCFRQLRGSTGMEVYPFDDLLPDTILLYRRTGKGPFWCQVAGCNRSFSHRTGAQKHGASHCRDLHLDPTTAVTLLTGRRPLTEDAYAEYRRRYSAQRMATKRQRQRQAQEAEQQVRRSSLSIAFYIGVASSAEPPFLWVAGYHRRRRVVSIRLRWPST